MDVTELVQDYRMLSWGYMTFDPATSASKTNAKQQLLQRQMLRLKRTLTLTLKPILGPKPNHNLHSNLNSLSAKISPSKQLLSKQF